MLRLALWSLFLALVLTAIGHLSNAWAVFEVLRVTQSEAHCVDLRSWILPYGAQCCESAGDGVDVVFGDRQLRACCVGVIEGLLGPAGRQRGACRVQVKDDGLDVDRP